MSAPPASVRPHCRFAPVVVLEASHLAPLAEARSSEAADEAKKLVDAAALAAERLVDATKEAEETATAAAAAAAAAEETATAAAAAAATFDDFGVQQVRGLLEIYGKDIEKGGHRYPALLSDSTLPQYEVYKKLVWERGWGGGGKSDEDVYEVIIMDDSLRKLLPDLVILIEIEGVQWLETATCERGFSLRTQILTAQRHSMGDSLLACLMMIHSNGPSLHEKEEVEKFLLAVVARFKAFKKRVPSYSNSKRPQRASASKAKSAVLSQLSGLENVVFNDFIDDELDSEDVSEQRASASLPDSVPIESEEERAAREADEMAALDSVGDYEADPNVMLEDVPQDIVIKTLKVSCASVAVLVFVCVCVRACARRRYVFVRIFI